MISQLAFALVSPAVRSVVNVITAPDTDATTRSEPFGVAPQVCPDLSSNRSFCPATSDAAELSRSETALRLTAPGRKTAHHQKMVTNSSSSLKITNLTN